MGVAVSGGWICGLVCDVIVGLSLDWLFAYDWCGVWELRGLFMVSAFGLYLFVGC